MSSLYDSSYVPSKTSGSPPAPRTGSSACHAVPSVGDSGVRGSLAVGEGEFVKSGSDMSDASWRLAISPRIVGLETGPGVDVETEVGAS